MKEFIVFAAGAAIGTVVTWKVLKAKYEQLAQEEIDSVKEAFSRREKMLNDELDDVATKIVETKKEIKEAEARAYQKFTKDVGYTSKEDEHMNGPYVITPEEFSENADEYEVISLNYYADGVVTDERDELLDDIEETIGLDSLDHFGEYEPDSVYVKNDELEYLYEILLDHRKYSDVIITKPRNMRI